MSSIEVISHENGIAKVKLTIGEREFVQEIFLDEKTAQKTLDKYLKDYEKGLEVPVSETPTIVWNPPKKNIFNRFKGAFK